MKLQRLDPPPDAAGAIAPVLTALADRFLARAHEIERALRRSGATVPDLSVREAFAAAFWQMVNGVERAVGGRPSGELPRERRDLLAAVGPLLWRSEPIYRSFFKPHGYAGDYRTIELMYDLEERPGENPTQPAIVNCLDYAYSTIHSVRAVWDRRHRLHRLLMDEYDARGGSLAVLDIACGGARYVRDFLCEAPRADGVRVTLVDQDPAAVEFVRRRALAGWERSARAVHLPISRIESLPGRDRFDVVICSGLFDYLPEEPARHLAGHLAGLLASGGVFVLTNFRSGEPSAFCKDWFGEWPIVYRDEDEVRGLFPSGCDVALEHSCNRSLVFGFCRVP